MHDNPRFPKHLRDFVTDALQSLWKFSNSYASVVANLNEALVASQTNEILDLCSGGGGPWLNLSRQMERGQNIPVHVRLSDKYPNLIAFAQIERDSSFKIKSLSSSVDATQVPGTLEGFRTMFSSFHHFDPIDARRILRNAVEEKTGIGVFEIPRRSIKTLFVLCFTPAVVFCLTPFIRPFRWSRLFWTYVVPVIPFVIGIDGLVSCLRAYSLEELQQMVREIEAELPHLRYRWRVGKSPGAFLPVTYLIGYPSS